MAEDTEKTTTAGEESLAGSSSSTPTQEERDNQTVERLLGPAPKPTEATTSETTTEEDAEETLEDGAEKPAEGVAAKGEATDADAEPDELTAEDIETVLDAIGEDALLENPRLAAKLDARIKVELDRRTAEATQQATLTQEQEGLVLQGRTAVQKVYDSFGKAAETLTKVKTQLSEAVAGRDFTDVQVESTLDPDSIKTALGEYGQALVIETGRSMNDNYMQAFREGAGLIGADQFTDVDGEHLKKVLQTADRILKDEKQGRIAANRYFFVETTKFLIERAMQSGRTKALAEVQTRRNALKKIVGDGGENTTRAAVAKVAASRKKTPPASPAPGASSETGPASMNRYRELKRAGKFDEADAVIAEIQSR